MYNGAFGRRTAEETGRDSRNDCRRCGDGRRLRRQGGNRPVLSGTAAAEGEQPRPALQPPALFSRTKCQEVDGNSHRKKIQTGSLDFSRPKFYYYFFSQKLLKSMWLYLSELRERIICPKSGSDTVR